MSGGLGPAGHIVSRDASHDGRIIPVLDTNPPLQRSAGEIGNIARGKNVGSARPKKLIDDNPVFTSNPALFAKATLGLMPTPAMTVSTARPDLLAKTLRYVGPLHAHLRGAPAGDGGGSRRSPPPSWLARFAWACTTSDRMQTHRNGKILTHHRPIALKPRAPKLT